MYRNVTDQDLNLHRSKNKKEVLYTKVEARKDNTGTPQLFSIRFVLGRWIGIYFKVVIGGTGLSIMLRRGVWGLGIIRQWNM